MGTYAATTTVSVEQSRNEIERTLVRYGAEKFMYGWQGNEAAIAFRVNGRHIRFTLPLPARDDKAYTTYRQGSTTFLRTQSAAVKLWEQACRQRWRALALVIKAKLEAVEAGITSFDDEFLAHILLPDGRPFGEWAKPQVEDMYLTGAMPPLLLEAPRT